MRDVPPHRQTEALSESAGELRCSFCGKLESEVERVIAGPPPSAICSECVALSAEILAEEREGDPG